MRSGTLQPKHFSKPRWAGARRESWGGVVYYNLHLYKVSPRVHVWWCFRVRVPQPAQIKRRRDIGREWGGDGVYLIICTYTSVISGACVVSAFRSLVLPPAKIIRRRDIGRERGWGCGVDITFCTNAKCHLGTCPCGKVVEEKACKMLRNFLTVFVS